MSLLQQEEREVDDAALGEELTKGSSHVVWAAIAATVVISIAIGAYVIAGQKPLICKATKSVSNFKLREGMDIGLKVTIRRERMYEFMDRLINLAIPRVKDFRGLNPKSFDGRGNYSMGMAEGTTFPEIDPAQVQWQQGLNITFITTANTNDEARELLSLFGMPFREK